MALRAWPEGHGPRHGKRRPGPSHDCTTIDSLTKEALILMKNDFHLAKIFNNKVRLSDSMTLKSHRSMLWAEFLVEIQIQEISCRADITGRSVNS